MGQESDYPALGDARGPPPLAVLEGGNFPEGWWPEGDRGGGSRLAFPFLLFRGGGSGAFPSVGFPPGLAIIGPLGPPVCFLPLSPWVFMAVFCDKGGKGVFSSPTNLRACPCPPRGAELGGVWEARDEEVVFAARCAGRGFCVVVVEGLGRVRGGSGARACAPQRGS